MVTFVSNAAYAWARASCTLPRTIPNEVLHEIKKVVQNVVPGSQLIPVIGSGGSGSEGGSFSISPEVQAAIDNCLEPSYRTYFTIVWVLVGVAIFIVLCFAIALIGYIAFQLMGAKIAKGVVEFTNVVKEELPKIRDALMIDKKNALKQIRVNFVLRYSSGYIPGKINHVYSVKGPLYYRRSHSRYLLEFIHPKDGASKIY